MDDDTAEEFEHIPWSELTSDHDRQRNRMLYYGAAAIVALVIGAVGARALLQPSPRAAEPAPAPASTVPTAETVVTVPAGPAPPPYSEADLMALVPAGTEAPAPPPGAVTPGFVLARAEWFVTDYFTADVDPAGGAQVRGALPEDAVLPELPQDGSGPAVSFVEWARAYRSEPLGSGLHRVHVAFRAIGSGEDGRFRRMPVRAVTVTLVDAPAATPAVVDLPAPARLPDPAVVLPWPTYAPEVPDDVIDAAFREAVGFGGFPALDGASSVDGRWRVVVTVADETGARWPLAVWLDDGGQLELPPWEHQP